MKLIRFWKDGEAKPGVIMGDVRKDCSAHFKDWDHDFFQQDGLAELNQLLKNKGNDLPNIATNAKWAPCTARPGKIIGIGLNYKDHALEVNASVPKEPTIFFKATTAVTGPYDDIIIPKNSTKTDWEIELGVFIKKDVKYLENEKSAKDYIAGYCISHDVSEREFQKERCGQWVKGKSCDTFNPIGPYLITSDEIKDVQNLSMKLTVNGLIRQDGNTKNMFFSVDYLVYYLSQFMTLEAGDLITTGTPAGVALGMENPEYLKPGDVVELHIENFGYQKSLVISYEK